MSKGELITLATISGAVVLWIFGDAIGCPAVLAAMLALGTLLCTGECFLAAASVRVVLMLGRVRPGPVVERRLITSQHHSSQLAFTRVPTLKQALPCRAVLCCAVP
jgi:hypothetical protein